MPSSNPLYFPASLMYVVVGFRRMYDIHFVLGPFLLHPVSVSSCFIEIDETCGSRDDMLCAEVGLDLDSCSCCFSTTLKKEQIEDIKNDDRSSIEQADGFNRLEH